MYRINKTSVLRMQVDDKELFDDAEEVDVDGSGDDDDLLGGLLGREEACEGHKGEEGAREAAAAASACWDVGCCRVRLLEWADSLEKLDGRPGPLESRSEACSPANAGSAVAYESGGLAASSSSSGKGEKVAAVVVVAPGESERSPGADATAAPAASPPPLRSTMGVNEAEILRRREALPPPGPLPPGIPDTETFPVVLGNEVMVSQNLMS